MKTNFWEATVCVSFSGVDRERFLSSAKANPSTYKDWGAETTGKEDKLISPV
jgi:hypothetical protein